MIEKVRGLLTEFKPEYDFNNSENFIEDGFLDSLDIIELLGILEGEFDIKFKSEDVKIENFMSYDSLTKLIESKEN